MCIGWDGNDEKVRMDGKGYCRYLYVNVGDMLMGEDVPVYLDRDSGVGFVDIDAVLPRIEVHR